LNDVPELVRHFPQIVRSILSSTDGCLAGVAPPAALLVGETTRSDQGGKIQIRIEKELRLLKLARHLNNELRDLDDGAR
jgi:hypothetical protein